MYIVYLEVIKASLLPVKMAPLFLDLMQKCENAGTVAMTFVAGLMMKMTIRRV